MIYQLHFFTNLVKEANSAKDHPPTTSLQTPRGPFLSLGTVVMASRSLMVPLGHGAGARTHLHWPSQGSQGATGQPQASGTSLGPGQDMGPRVGPAQQDSWPGRTGLWRSWRPALLWHYWGRCWWPPGAETGSWATGWVGGGPRALTRAFISNSKEKTWGKAWVLWESALAQADIPRKAPSPTRAEVCAPLGCLLQPRGYA